MHLSNDIALNGGPISPPKEDGSSQADLKRSNEVKSQKEFHVFPRSCSLEGLTEISPSLEGVELKTLAPLDTICVRTRNSNYRIFLLDPRTGRALVEGGGGFIELVEATVTGSTFGGSMLKIGWIGIGLRMEICASGKCIVTSPVQSFRVEHQTSVELASSMCQ